MTDKLELKSSHEVVYTVDVADVNSIFYCKPTDPDILTVLMKDGKKLYCDEVCPVDSMQEEPVSEDLMEATNNYCVNARKGYPRVKDETDRYICNAFKAGAKWHKANPWKLADGDVLPEIDREVIALLDNGKVVFAHRPPEFWDGKDIVTGTIIRYHPKTYDKGGWNIPDVKYWLDCSMPKEIEL